MSGASEWTKVSGKIESDHVVRVLDAGFDLKSKMYFLVMELLKGEDLETLVARDGPLAPAMVADLMLQLAGVLEAAHNYRDSQGQVKPIVRRDLKPENLFLVSVRGAHCSRCSTLGSPKCCPRRA